MPEEKLEEKTKPCKWIETCTFMKETELAVGKGACRGLIGNYKTNCVVYLNVNDINQDTRNHSF
ncbi:hypothetical protein KY342_03900 [Candidatus Woesearchaeota archaeon]|nr:hypothetical protein [Candidatus Woesearchaeota archaeon]